MIGKHTLVLLVVMGMLFPLAGSDDVPPGYDWLTPDNDQLLVQLTRALETSPVVVVRCVENTGFGFWEVIIAGREDGIFIIYQRVYQKSYDSKKMVLEKKASTVLSPKITAEVYKSIARTKKFFLAPKTEEKRDDARTIDDGLEVVISLFQNETWTIASEHVMGVGEMSVQFMNLYKDLKRVAKPIFHKELRP